MVLSEFWERIELFLWGKGFGVGKQEKMILFHLHDGREKYMSELLKELIKNYPAEKWNQTTLNVRVENLKDLGFVDKKEKDYKIFVKLSGIGKHYLELVSRWREDIRREGRKNEANSGINDVNA